jgi:hypothetical protein
MKVGFRCRCGRLRCALYPSRSVRPACSRGATHMRTYVTRQPAPNSLPDADECTWGLGFYLLSERAI